MSLSKETPRPSPATEVSIQFEQQLDHVSRWLTFWKHNQCVGILQKLLRICTLDEMNFLWSVSEPALHRDFLYSSSLDFPHHGFMPISTHRSRQIRRRLEERRLRSKGNEKAIHRMQSAMLRSMTDIKQLCQYGVESDGKSEQGTTLPTINIYAAKNRQIKYLASDYSSKSTEIPVIKSTNDDIRVMRRHMQKNRIPIAITMKTGIREPYLTATKGQRKLEHTSLQDSVEASKIKEGEIVIYWFQNVWNAFQRHEFLKQIVKILNAPLMYDLAGLLSVRLHRDFIAELPQTLSLKILSYLDARELFIASMVSIKWQTLAENDQLWKLKCKESKIVDIPVQTTLTHSASAQALWKRIFQTNLTLRKNWERGRCRVLEVSGHSNRVLCVRFNGRRMASGSLDRTLRIWNSSTGMLLQTLNGHSRGIWAVRFYGRNLLVSSSYDSTIKIWNMKSGTCIKTLYSHNGPVWAIERKGDLLLSGSQDKTAKLWDIRRYRLLLTLSGHTAAIFAVDIDDSISIALTGSADRSIRLWNIINGDCHRIIWAGQASSVMAVNINMGFIASSSDSIITLWNAKTGEKVNQYIGHSRRIECLQLRMTDPDSAVGYIVSAGKDGFVKYWDIKEGTCIQTLRGHMDAVNSIHFDELRIASASYDHEIKIWDFNVETDSVNVTPKT